jgi:hypothetical protein
MAAKVSGGTQGGGGPWLRMQSAPAEPGPRGGLQSAPAGSEPQGGLIREGVVNGRVSDRRRPVGMRLPGGAGDLNTSPLASCRLGHVRERANAVNSAFGGCKIRAPCSPPLELSQPLGAVCDSEGPVRRPEPPLVGTLAAAVSSSAAAACTAPIGRRGGNPAWRLWRRLGR